MTYTLAGPVDEQTFTLSFPHLFSYAPTETTYFAFSYPFSLEESIEKLDQIEAKLKDHPTIYFHREILYHSLEGRPMEIITLSSKDGMTS